MTKGKILAALDEIREPQGLTQYAAAEAAESLAANWALAFADLDGNVSAKRRIVKQDIEQTCEIMRAFGQAVLLKLAQ